MNILDCKFTSTICPICGNADCDKELYLSNFSMNDLSEEKFSARRIPDRIHYRIVRCSNCGLVRSNPVADKNMLSALYGGSKFTYENESVYAAQAYLACLKSSEKHILSGKDRILEIGCGNGFFLKKAHELGFKQVYGVEPSQDAVLKADEHIRKNILCSMFREGLFPPDYFDCVCHFHVLDHFLNPLEVTKECYRILKPGGILLVVCHDIGSFAAHILGERNPVIDIEHIHLFDKKTMKKFHEKVGFNIKEIASLKNTYPLYYWNRLLPAPYFLKGITDFILKTTGLGNVKLAIKAGNMSITAVK